MRRFFAAAVVIALVGVMVAAIPAAAKADDNGGTVISSVTRNVTNTMAYTDPCTGETGTAYTVATVVSVLTLRPNDTLSRAFELSGYFTLVYPTTTITGHFVRTDTIGGGVNDVQTIVLMAQGTASDGSTFTIQFIFHLNETGTGVTLSFDKCL